MPVYTPRSDIPEDHQDNPGPAVPLGLNPSAGRPRQTTALARAGWLARHRDRLMAAGTAGTLAAAGWLAATAPHDAVWLDGAGYHIDQVVLSPSAQGYVGRGAMVSVHQDAQTGTLTGSGAMQFGGHRTAAECRVAGTRETCSFTVDGASLGALDVLEADGGAEWWSRTYGDGATTRIDIANGVPIPVPVPLGR